MEALFTEENMADLPFDVLQKIQAKIGLKKFRTMFAKANASGSSGTQEEQEFETVETGLNKRGRNTKSKDDEGEEDAGGGWKSDSGRQEKKKKKSKSAPVEMTSKKPVSKFRKVVAGLAAPSRDPRFDDLSELKAAMAELKKTKDEDRREQLVKLVQRMKEQSKAQKEKDARSDAKSKRMKAERELVQGGKKPFYLKKSDEKTLELVEQYKKAKQDGSLEKKLRTKRKRTSSKLKKDYLPERRQAYD